MGLFSSKNSLNLNELEKAYVSMVYKSAIQDGIPGTEKISVKVEKGKKLTDEELIFTIKLIEAFNRGMTSHIESGRVDKEYEKLVQIGENVLDKIK